MNKVETDFKDKAIIRGDILLFTKGNALSFVVACRENNIQLLGIDGFYLIEDMIQPSITNSVDFSSSKFIQKSDNIYSEAMQFFNGKDEKLYFEIVCSE